MLFIYIIYNIFVNQNFSPKNPWAIISYFFGLHAGTDNEIVKMMTKKSKYKKRHIYYGKSSESSFFPRVFTPFVSIFTFAAELPRIP